ncbi:hypothetical protein [Ktedonobacter robiniae]|uniref:Uncharacterized protein n=1 Tax=Ktedonobacter robiniae TaxID=2778365 RepID=A0ABQ3UJR7_9CHLR|nr:hypothetical protein [Ktedonobacter robiniae]GHO52907.1 hypothetical protein KSB_13820 [Ktedonobacter robiniae]
MQPSIAWDDNGEALVWNLLKPHVPVINDAIKASWIKYLDINIEKRFPFDARTRANIVNNYICHEIRHRFADIPGVTITEHLGFLVLNFSDLVLSRFKILDRNLRAGNVWTKRQRDYDDLLELPDLPPKAIRVTIGYQLDRSETEIKNILVTRPAHRKIAWHFSILNENISTIQPTLTLPNEVMQPDQSDKKRRVKPKDPKQPKRDVSTPAEQPPESKAKPTDVLKKEGDEPPSESEDKTIPFKKSDSDNTTSSKKPPRIKPNGLENSGEDNGATS